MKNNRIFTIVALVIALTLLGSALAGCGGKENIKIGAPMPMTGPYASDGEQMQMALQMAIEEHKCQGWCIGSPVNLSAW